MGRMVYRGGSAGNMGGVPGGDINRAKLALQGNRPDEAERLLRKRLERRPDDNATRLLLAQALLQMQRVDDAITETRRIIRDQPTNADAHLILSAALTQNPRTMQQAEEAARRAVQLQPKAARSHVQLAEVLAARKKLKDARAEAEEAARLEPRLPAAHLIRAMVLLADDDPVGAVSASESALRYDNSLFAAHFTLANALIEVRRYDDALNALNRAHTLNPLLPAATIHALRGRVYLKERKYGQAYREFVSSHRSAGRLTWLAPYVALLQFAQVFGRYGPQVALVVLLVLILAGIGFIPLAGPWIVVLLVLGLTGVSIFTTIRQYQGRILPAGNARYTALAAITVAGAVVLGLALWASFGIVGATSHGKGQWLTPLTAFIAVFLAVLAAGGAAYALNRWGGRLSRSGPAPTARA